jgi:hypothetical protein
MVPRAHNISHDGDGDGDDNNAQRVDEDQIVVLAKSSIVVLPWQHV